MNAKLEKQFITQNRTYCFKYEKIQTRHKNTKRSINKWTDIVRAKQEVKIQEKVRINKERVMGRWHAYGKAKLTWKRATLKCENKQPSRSNKNKQRKTNNMSTTEVTTMTYTQAQIQVRTNNKSVVNADGHNHLLIMERQKWRETELKKKIEECNVQVKKIVTKDNGYLIELESYEKAKQLVEQSNQIHTLSKEDPIYFLFANGAASQETIQSIHTIIFEGFYYFSHDM
jgi:thiol:disulfide interchange protein